jgi:hypothetical protein
MSRQNLKVQEIPTFEMISSFGSAPDPSLFQEVGPLTSVPDPDDHMFWAPWIISTTSKKIKKTLFLLFCDFSMTFYI